ASGELNGASRDRHRVDGLVEVHGHACVGADVRRVVRGSLRDDRGRRVVYRRTGREAEGGSQHRGPACIGDGTCHIYRVLRSRQQVTGWGNVNDLATTDYRAIRG